jgi:ATP-dependent protease Clp ATPase subunit
MAIKEQQVVVKELERIIETFKASEGEIRPHFILTGPSGSGKSHSISSLADIYELAYLEINAAQLTKEGVSGNSLTKAMAPLSQNADRLTICFVDEFDKLFISGNSNSQLAHESTNGVQNEFLKILESKTASVFGDYGKYFDIPVDNVLFIFAGAFNGEEEIDLDKLRMYGLKTEFLGRVGLIYNLKKLSIDSMREALVNSKLLAAYLALYPDADKGKVVEEVMKAVVSMHEKNTLGIRLINTLLHQYFIKGGVLTEKTVKTSSFQKTLSLSDRKSSVL